MYRMDSSNFSMFKKRVIDKYYAYEHDAFKMSTIKQTIIDIPGSTYKPEDDLLRGTLEKWSDSTYTQISAGAFLNQPNLSYVSFPNITAIGSYAFGNCTNLPSQVFSKVTTVGAYAFQYCTNMDSIELPKVTTIGGYAFLGCNLLSKLDLPECKTLEAYALCNMHTSEVFISYYVPLSLPKLENIAQNAFNGNTADMYLPMLKSITSTAATPFFSYMGSVIKLGNSELTEYPVFHSTFWQASATSNLQSLYLYYNKVISASNTGWSFPPTTKIYVLPSLVESYKTAPGWSAYAVRINPITE